jgi:hypothetical protein
MSIESLKQYADLSFDRAVAKKNALERAESRQIMAYRDHLFRADPETICLVKTLQEQKQFYILDTNKNPCLIDNPAEFLSLLIERNQESLNAYHQLHQTLKQKRL